MQVTGLQGDCISFLVFIQEIHSFCLAIIINSL